MPAHLRFAIIGGRGFGKTSLAASLMSIAGNTNGTIIVDGPTQAILAIKNDELANGGQLSATEWDDIQKLRFTIQSSENERWVISFKDYPGEFFEKYRVATNSRESEKSKSRIMDSLAAWKARRLEASLLRSAALVVLLPVDIQTGGYKGEFEVYLQKVCDFVEKNHQSLARVPICLAINKWDMNDNPQQDINTLLEDGDSPFARFYSSLKTLVGDNLICMPVSAFGKHESESKDKKAAGGIPMNVLEMLLALTRRIDSNRLRVLETGGEPWYTPRQLFTIPAIALWRWISGLSKADHVERARRIVMSAAKRWGLAFVIIATVVACGICISNAFSARRTLSKIERTALEIDNPTIDSRDQILSLDDEFKQVNATWRNAFGSNADRQIARLKDGVNAAVLLNVSNRLESADLRDGTVDTMHPTNRIARLEGRLAVTTNAMSLLFSDAGNFNSSRSALRGIKGTLNAEKTVLEKFRESDADIFEKLESAEQHDHARALWELVQRYESDSNARPEVLKRLRITLDSNQETAASNLQSQLDGIRDAFPGDELATVVVRTTNMVSRIDESAGLFVATNFTPFARLRSNLLNDAYTCWTNEVAKFADDTNLTAGDRTVLHIRVIESCAVVDGIWDTSTPEAMKVGAIKTAAMSATNELARYVQWESDFAKTVGNKTPEEGKAAALEQFLNDHDPDYIYPDYKQKWNRLQTEMAVITDELLSKLTNELASTLPGTTNVNAVIARIAVSNRIDVISSYKTILPSSKGNQLDKMIGEEKNRFDEIDLYEAFDEGWTAVLQSSGENQIKEYKKFLDDHPQDRYPRRQEARATLDSKLTELIAIEESRYQDGLKKNSDTESDSATARIAKAKRRIAAGETILRHIPWHAVAKTQIESDCFTTNIWSSYAIWESDWKEKVEDGAPDEKARRIDDFMDLHPRNDFPRFEKKYVEAETEMHDLSTNEWSLLQTFISTNAIEYLPDVPNGHEIAADNQSNRIELARARLPKSYATKLDALQKKCLSELEEARGNQSLNDEIASLENAPLNDRLARCLEFKKLHSELELHSELASRILEIETNARNEIDGRFADVLNSAKPASTNYLACKDYHERLAIAFADKATYYPLNSKQRVDFSQAAVRESDQAAKYGKWDNIQKSIAKIKNEYDPDKPEKTISAILAFDGHYTNEWTSADDIHSCFYEREGLLNGAEDRLKEIRNQELEPWESVPRDDDGKIRCLEERIHVLEMFSMEKKFYPGLEASVEQETLLANAQKSLKDAKDCRDFRNEFTTLKKSLSDWEDSKCRDEIQKFLRKFPSEQYEGLAADIDSNYSELRKLESMFSTRVSWGIDAKKAKEEVNAVRKLDDIAPTADWESHRSSLFRLKDTIEPYLHETDIRVEALNLDKQIAACIVECNRHLGAGSYKSLKELHDEYTTNPTSENFRKLNLALLAFDKSKASAEEKSNVDTWCKGLKDDGAIIQALAKTLTDFYNSPDSVRFGRLKSEFTGISHEGIHHRKLSMIMYDALPFWANLEVFVSSIDQTTPVYCHEIKVDLKKNDGNTIIIRVKDSSGKKDWWSCTKIAKGPKSLTCKKFIQRNWSFEISHDTTASLDRQKFSFPKIDWYWVFAKGMKHDFVTYPSNPHTIKYGSRLQFVFSDLPKISIPDYNYYEELPK